MGPGRGLTGMWTPLVSVELSITLLLQREDSMPLGTLSMWGIKPSTSIKKSQRET
jgi:hypothetical protein